MNRELSIRPQSFKHQLLAELKPVEFVHLEQGDGGSSCCGSSCDHSTVDTEVFIPGSFTWVEEYCHCVCLWIKSAEISALEVVATIARKTEVGLPQE